MRVVARSCMSMYLGLASGLVGCGHDAGATLASRLAAHDYVLESSQGFTPVEGTDVRLSFSENGRDISFSAGCNHHSSAFSIDEGRLVVTGFASTEIGCDPALHEQDDWLATFMADRPRVEQSGDRLAFEGAQATLEFLDREVAEPDKPLVDVLWTVDTFIVGDAAGNISLETPPTLRFDADGNLEIFTGCRAGTASFRQKADKLTLSSVQYADVTCTARDQYADDGVRAVIDDGEVTFAIDASRLTIQRGAERGLAALAE